MSNASTPELKTKPLAGTIFMKDSVDLPAAEDGTERKMGVIHVQTSDDVVRITDFSRQHEGLVEGQPVKLVYTEVTQPKGERLVTYRNLVSAVQPQG